jgi:hypothetical protein
MLVTSITKWLLPMIKDKDLQDFSTLGMASKLYSLMTPAELLEREIFDRPFVITPEEFTSFEELLSVREEIRNLKLVPIKDDYMHDLYNSIDKEELLEEVNSYTSDSNLTFIQNQYPYWLSSDVNQSLIWIKDGVRPLEITSFLARLIFRLDVSPDEIILFERPSNTKSVLIKGTFPAMRHIHLWTKKKNNG